MDQVSRETHIIELHPDQVTSNSMRVVCQHCWKEFLCVGELRLHEGIEHPPSPEPLSCDQCDMNTFPDKTALRLHLRKMHDVGVSICDTCGGRFCSEDHLNRHVIRVDSTDKESNGESHLRHLQQKLPIKGVSRSPQNDRPSK